MEGFSFIGRNCLPKGICENTINVHGQIEDRCVTCDTDFCNTGSGASGGWAGTRLLWSGGGGGGLMSMVVWSTVVIFYSGSSVSIGSE